MIGLTPLENVMKIQLTLSPEQLGLLADELAFASLNDKLLDRLNPAWKELKAIVRLADDEANGKMVRQASYKIIR